MLPGGGVLATSFRPAPCRLFSICFSVVRMHSRSTLSVIAKALTGHVTEQMREHYSTVGLDEKRAAVASMLRLLPQGESADNGADAGTPANDTVEAEAAKAAK